MKSAKKSQLDCQKRLSLDERQGNDVANKFAMMYFAALKMM